VLAEFWADGPSSETPPGHWNLIANNVADSPGFVRQIGGVGPVVDNLEWDVKVYFAINAALHDAACAAWGAKRYYDGWRPLTAVRYLGGHGQSTDPTLPSYSTNGLPLITNLIELVTVQSVASGRHAGLTPGKIAIFTWPGPPTNPATQYSGVKWIHADNWITYQKTNFVTPAFPGYISGHSTFSRAGAEILAAITGTPFFPGGMGVYTFTNLSFEHGPSAPVQLQWATYFDASDQAGISRIWGGIHPPVDDFTGRITGSMVGQTVWALAKQYFNGSVLQAPITASLHQTGGGTNRLTCNSIRGMYYKLQSTTDLNLPFSDEQEGAVLAFDTKMTITATATDQAKFYRISCSLMP
jgi:hypothetical protein